MKSMCSCWREGEIWSLQLSHLPWEPRVHCTLLITDKMLLLPQSSLTWSLLVWTNIRNILAHFWFGNGSILTLLYIEVCFQLYVWQLFCPDLSCVYSFRARQHTAIQLPRRGTTSTLRLLTKSWSSLKHYPIPLAFIQYKWIRVSCKFHRISMISQVHKGWERKVACSDLTWFVQGCEKALWQSQIGKNPVIQIMALQTSFPEREISLPLKTKFSATSLVCSI